VAGDWCETNWRTVDPDTVKVCDYSHKSGDSGKHPVLGGRSRADEHYYKLRKKRSGEKAENELNCNLIRVAFHSLMVKVTQNTIGAEGTMFYPWWLTTQTKAGSDELSRAERKAEFEVFYTYTW
jgi:hypothetical protein